MPVLKKGGGAAASGGDKVAVSDSQRESEWLESMERLMGWIYEHFSRYQMDEAQQGLIQSAERRFNVSHDQIADKSDPFGQLRRWLSNKKYKNALQEFEFICPEEMDKSVQSIYMQTLNGIKVQVALATLRADNKDIEEFKSQVKQLFPAKKKGSSAEEFKLAEQIRNELLAVNTTANVTSLLKKHSTSKFDEVVADFWAELEKHRPMTTLEVIMSDISSGTYQPRIAFHGRAEPEPADNCADLRSSSSKGPVAGTKQAAAEAAQSTTQKRTTRSEQASGSREETSEKGGKGAGEEREAEEPMVLSAWDLRRALAYACQSDDEAAFTPIHQQRHPDVVEYLAKRKVAKQAKPTKNGGAPPETDGETEAKRVTRKRVRGAVEEDGEEEAGAESPVEAVKALLDSKRKRGGGGAGAGASQAAASKPQKETPAKESEKENEEPAVTERVTRGRASQSESLDVVRRLREDQRMLMSSTRDPLEEVRKISKGAVADGKRIRVNPDSPGQKITWDSDEEDDEQRVALPSPKTLSYRPRARLSRGSPAVGGKGGSGGKSESKRVRWTEEEVDSLKDGVKSIGEGNWQKILERKKFHTTRSAVDLKDKWRNLKKYNHV